MPRSKKTRKERSKTFKIDNERYLYEYLQFVADGGLYWDDWHTKCIQIFSYREEEVDGDLVFHNEDNEGAKLTLASVKSRFTRLEKKWNSWIFDPSNNLILPGQADSGSLLPKLKNRPKVKVIKKPPIDLPGIFETAKQLGVLVPPSGGQIAKMEEEEIAKMEK